MMKHGLAAAAAIVPSLLSAGTEAGFDVNTVISSAVDTTKSQIFTALGTVVPAIVAITAAVVAVKFGISWLRRIRG